MSSLSIEQRRTIIAQVIDQLTREPGSYAFFRSRVGSEGRGCVLAWAAHFAEHDYIPSHEDRLSYAAREVFGVTLPEWPSQGWGIGFEAQFYDEMDAALQRAVGPIHHGWTSDAGKAVVALTEWLKGHPELLPQT